MEEHVHLEPSPGSSIAAFGMSRSRLPSSARWMIWASLAIVAAVFVGWWAVRAPVLIPERTILLIVTNGARATALPASLATHLPPVWQTALEKHSSLPVTLGVAQTDEGLMPFATIPRWRSSVGFIVADASGWQKTLSEQPLQKNKRVFRLMDAWFWGNAGFADVKAWFDPNALVSSAQSSPEEVSSDLKSFGISVKGALAGTDLPFAPNPSSQTLPEADMSIRLPLSIEEDGLMRPLMDEMRVGDLTMSQMPLLPLRVDRRLRPDGTIRNTRLTFGTDLSPKQATLILSGFGVSDNRQVRLPDGTIMLTTNLVSASGTHLFDTRTSPRFGTIRLQKRQLDYGENIDDPLPTAPNECHLTSSSIFLSSLGVMRIISFLNLLKNDLPFPSILLGSSHGHLAFCFSFHNPVDK